ncbi:L,D-transpeptidase [Desulforamulus ferrireducens]|uniref:Uncharacterized protein n=1 Tax=Desulforamulus ferrireducens TaxID=1833852 RepID=A0A1S6IX66_9FIRM|nr:L,D-transpeptidase [Desulforamulus ferrireducens]AQS59345.1 hypothetical protein B0537_09735 [Desulforamulus ferrireducens]
MILQISRARLLLYGVILATLLILWLTIACLVMERVENSPEGLVVVTLKFLAPMKPTAIEDLVITRNGHPGKVPFTYTWQTANTLQIKISEQDYPRGHRYHYKFKGAPSMFWPFFVWAGGDFQAKVPVRFLGIEASDTVPSRGPAVLKFNTNLKADEIKNYIKLPVPGRLEPANVTAQPDYSRWLYWPSTKLQNLSTYEIEILKGLPNQQGEKLTKSIIARFKTTPEFLIEAAYPRPGSGSIWLSREIAIEANQPLKEGSLIIEGLPGRSVIKDNRIYYLPERILLPSKTYRVKAHLVSVSNETLDYEYSFSTTNLGQHRWLEFKHAPSPTLWLMQGNKTLREMPVAVKPGRPLPVGTLYEQNRTDHWFRLNADILLHVLPKGRTDRHENLGLPTTYSCIYLEEKDLKELLQALPPNFMFISH